MSQIGKRLARQVVRDVGWAGSLYGLTLGWMPGCLLGFALVSTASLMWWRWERAPARRAHVTTPGVTRYALWRGITR